MRRFRFPLQPLRILREQKEQVAQQRYAAALRDVEAAEHRVQNTSAELESCWSWLREQLSDGAFAERLESTGAYCGVLDGRRKQEEADLRRERERLDQAWHALMLATRARETLDRFFAKSRREYDLDAQREEQKSLDEIGTRRAALNAMRRELAPAELEYAS